MSSWLFNALLLFVIAAPAARADLGDSDLPVVRTRGDAEYLKARMPAEQFNVQTPDEERRLLLEQGYIMPRERDALFRKLNLDTKLKKFDEMDKDMLVMDAKAYTLPELIKQYPMLNTTVLKRLKTEVENFR